MDDRTSKSVPPDRRNSSDRAPRRLLPEIMLARPRGSIRRGQNMIQERRSTSGYYPGRKMDLEMRTASRMSFAGHLLDKRPALRRKQPQTLSRCRSADLVLAPDRKSTR